MASIKKLDERKFKITVSNGYHPDGRNIAKAKTMVVPKSVQARSVMQYVSHAAEEIEREVKLGYSEDGEMTFEEFALRWLNRQTKYAVSTLNGYRKLLERTYPHIGQIKLNRLRPIAIEKMLIALRKRYRCYTVASLLGHSQVSTTLDIYRNAFNKNRKKGSDELQKGLGV